MQCAAPCRLFCSIAGTLALGACATFPAPRQAPVSLSQAEAGGAQGARVTWAGQVVHVSNHAQRSCALIQARPLAAGAKPDLLSPSPGYFIACKTGQYDPYQIYAGRRVTVSGTIEARPGNTSGQVPSYAVLAANAVYAWGAGGPSTPTWAVVAGRASTDDVSSSYPLAARTP